MYGEDLDSISLLFTGSTRVLACSRNFFICERGYGLEVYLFDLRPSALAKKKTFSTVVITPVSAAESFLGERVFHCLGTQGRNWRIGTWKRLYDRQARTMSGTEPMTMTTTMTSRPTFASRSSCNPSISRLRELGLDPSLRSRNSKTNQTTTTTSPRLRSLMVSQGTR